MRAFERENFISREAIVEQLRRAYDSQTPVAKLKGVYRPYICPFEMVLRHIPRNAAVLDIGCGGGAFLSTIASFCAPRQLSGLEISETALTRARRALRNVYPTPKLELYDGRNFPNWVHEHEIVLLIDVLELLPHPEQKKFLHRLFQSMAPGSQLILKEINGANRFLKILNQGHNILSGGRPTFENSMIDTMEMVNEVGFNILTHAEKRTLIYPHFALVCEKPRI